MTTLNMRLGYEPDVISELAAVVEFEHKQIDEYGESYSELLELTSEPTHPLAYTPMQELDIAELADEL